MLFRLLTSRKVALKNENVGKLKHKISYLKNLVIFLSIYTTFLLSQNIIPVKSEHTNGDELPMELHEVKEPLCGAGSIYMKSKTFLYSILNHKVHILETKFHKIFTRKKNVLQNTILPIKQTFP